MKTVQLKNGTTELKGAVNTTYFTLRELSKTSPLAVYELMELCNNRDHKIFSDRLEQDLLTFGLIQQGGRVHPTIKNVVLSAVVRDGFDISLVSPLADESERVFDGAIGTMPS